jgi:hypothetical protein
MKTTYRSSAKLPFEEKRLVGCDVERLAWSMPDKNHKSVALITTYRSVKQIDEYHFDLCGLLDTNGNMPLTETSARKGKTENPREGNINPLGLLQMTFNELAGVLNGVGFTAVERGDEICIGRDTKAIFVSRDILLMTVDDLLFVAKQVGDLL